MEHRMILMDADFKTVHKVVVARRKHKAEHGGVDAKEFLDDVEDRSMLYCTDCGKAMSDER